LGSWGYPPVVGFWELSAKMRVLFVSFAVGFTPIAPPLQAFILSPYSWKAYGIRLNLPGLCKYWQDFPPLAMAGLCFGTLSLIYTGLSLSPLVDI
jgi:hypothetical protein